jgi:hypothetical protein
MARAVKMMATWAMKKVRGSRATRVRAMRVMTETSPRDEGDNGHDNKLGTKVAATARTVVTATVRGITMAARATATGAKRATATMTMMATTVTMAMMATTAMMATMAMMMPNGDNYNENQAATTARVMTTLASDSDRGKKGGGNDGNNGNDGKFGNNGDDDAK